MATFGVRFLPSDDSTFRANMNSDEGMNTSFGEVHNIRVVDNDYEILNNKPSINGVELIGNKTSEDLKIVLRNTTDGWNSQPSLLAEENVIYIYTDYRVIDNGDGTYTYVPGIKVGNGTAYLIDMPFTQAENTDYEEHIRNNTIHVTEEEKAFWNSKWRGYIDGANPALLVFTTN